jgi:hypothetical protein
LEYLGDEVLQDANGRGSHFAAWVIIPALVGMASGVKKGGYKENGFSTASIIVRKRGKISEQGGNRFQRPKYDLF